MTSLKFFKVFFVCVMFGTLLSSCSNLNEDAELYGETSELNGIIGQQGDEDTLSEESGDTEEADFDTDCFDFVFPIEIAFPDGSNTTFEDGTTLEMAIEEWEDLDLDSLGLPMPIYPINIVLQDGTEMEVLRDEEFIAILEECEANEEDEDGRW